MKISTEISSASRIVGEEKAIELCARAGFDAWDFSMFDMCKYDYPTKSILYSHHPLAHSDYLSFARRLKKVSDDNGIYCNQSHAPYPSVPGVRDYLKRAIECTAEAGGKICVIHPHFVSEEENKEIYNEFLPFAKDYGVKIATENMWDWDYEKDESSFAICSTGESFKKLVDIVDDDYFVACLDIGHAEMRGSGSGAVNMIRALGKKLQAVHVHDNDKWQDSHKIPFSDSIDFVSVAAALKEIGYNGEITLEANAYLKDFTRENILDGLKDMAAAARRLADMVK